MKRLLSTMRFVLGMMLVIGVMLAIQAFAIQFIFDFTTTEWAKWLAVIVWCYFATVLTVYLAQTDTAIKVLGRWFSL